MLPNRIITKPASHFILEDGSEDEMCWGKTTSGKFTVRLVYDLVVAMA